MTQTTIINLLEKIKKILLYKDRNDDTIISLYDLALVIKKKNIYYNKMIARNFNTVISNNCNDVKLYINNIDYDKEELILILEYISKYKISCKKELDKIILEPIDKTPNFIISKFNTDKISLIFDNVMKYKDYIKEEHFRIPSSNSSFLINITNHGVTVYEEKNDKKEFILSSYNFKDSYTLQTNSQVIRNLLTNNEEILFKNTFIKIENCPKWAQNKLSQIRQKQIIEKNLPKVKKIEKK